MTSDRRVLHDEVLPRSSNDPIIDWLLDSDPSIRWQVMRDLTDMSAETVAAERSRVASEGWGPRLLDQQHPDGHWGDGVTTPRWWSNLYTLLFLRDLGLDPKSVRAQIAIDRVRTNLTWGPEFGDSPFFEGEVEPCINGRVVALGAYFGERSDRLVDRLLSEQLGDGGWNCEAEHGSVRSSFHTTICVLEGLLEYEQAAGADPQVASARYHYDILRALDYLRLAGIHSDARIRDAIQIVKGARQADGRWLLDHSYDEALAFPFAESAGDPSRWNTLRALRVLRWHEQTQSKSATG